MSQPSSQALRVQVNSVAESEVRSGHLEIHASNIREQITESKAGDLVVVTDRRQRFLAIGLYDPHHDIRIRVLHAGGPITLSTQWWAHRLDAAIVRRASLFGPLHQPQQVVDTNGYRLINSNADGWPGLIADRYGRTLVIEPKSAVWFPFLPMLVKMINERLPECNIIVRLHNELKELGAPHHLIDGLALAGRLEDPMKFRENRLTLEAEILTGPKTGFYLDQRENRRRLEKMAEHRRVLNAFAFHNGFAPYLLRGGAKEVLSLDVSHAALGYEKRMLQLNDLTTSGSYEALQADPFQWMLNADHREFDMAILDPPALTNNEKEAEDALQAYNKLAATALQRLVRGGILACSSRSAHVSAENFYDAVRSAARRSGRNWREFQRGRHAPDHHVQTPNEEYLKSIYLQMES